MNRRECLKSLGVLGISLALPSIAIELASDSQVDTEWDRLQSLKYDGLSDHPRIVLLRHQVSTLPVADEYKSALLHSVDIYADQILAKSEVPIDGGWDDLEAIQQVTLSDRVEEWWQNRDEPQDS